VTKLYHPELGRTIEVADRAVWVHLQSGWVFAADATNDEDDTNAIDAEQALDAYDDAVSDGGEEE